MLRRVAVARADVSEELSASIIKVTRIGELGTLAVTSNRRMLRRNTSQKTAFFIAAAVKTSNVTFCFLVFIISDYEKVQHPSNSECMNDTTCSCYSLELGFNTDHEAPFDNT
jgi:hypothetical protein